MSHHCPTTAPSAAANGTAFRPVVDGQQRPPHPGVTVWSNTASSSSEEKLFEDIGITSGTKRG